MAESARSSIKTITRIMLAVILIIAMAFPVQSFASTSSGTSKKKYTIEFKNVTDKIVLKKGSKLRIKYKVSNGKKIRAVFTSSNPKVITVSAKGVVKALKKGTAKITIRDADNPKVKSTVKLRVGKRVKSVKINGVKYLRAGRVKKYTVTVKAASATEKSVVWKSSNSKVASVSKKGYVTAKKNGKVTLTATAADGSGKKDKIVVYVHKYLFSDAKWIAHRGFHASVPENTAEAFRQAGMRNYWGVECDIWETKHVIPETPAEEDPVTDPVSTEGGGSDPSDPVVSGDAAETPDEEVDSTASPDSTDADAPAVDPADPAGDQETDPADDPAADPAEGLNAGEEKPAETFDIVINHDDTFERIWGVNRRVKDMTAEEIRSDSRLSQICFFDEYLQICKEYDMVPVIEIKDFYMSPEAIAKTIGMIYDLDNGETLSNVHFVSYGVSALKTFSDYARDTYGIVPFTSLFINKSVDENISLAIDAGLSGVSLSKAVLSLSVYKRCVDNGLIVDVWTYYGNVKDDEYMYLHLISGLYKLATATIDRWLFD